MKKLTFFLLFFVMLFIVGCSSAQTVEETSTQSTVQTVYLDSQTTPVQSAATPVQTVRASDDSYIYLPRGKDVIVEFWNDEESSKRLTFFNTEIDFILAPRERIELRFNIEQANELEYMFGTKYRIISIW